MDLIWQHFVDLFSLPIFPSPLPGPGANIPAEIIELILLHVSRNNTVLQVYRNYQRDIQEGRRKPNPEYLRRAIPLASPRHVLSHCALVSRFWANQSRRLLFNRATLTIESLEDALAFHRYALYGSPNLNKICDLIDKISVTQDYADPRSLLDLVFLPSTRNKLTRLLIRGPVPTHIRPARLDSPHWTLTNEMIMSSPSVTAYNDVTLENIHLPSFAHLTKYLSYFRRGKRLFIESLTWEGKSNPGLWGVVRSHQSPPHTTFTAAGCTSNHLVCLQAVTWYPNFPLHAASEQDRHWAIGLMLLIGNFYQGLPFIPPPGPAPLPFDVPRGYTFRQKPRIWLGSDPTAEGEYSVFTFAALGNMGYAEIILHFVCGLKPPTPGVRHSGRSPRPIRIVALGVEIKCVDEESPTGHTTVDLSFLRREIEDRQELRMVVFAFHDHTTMLRAVRDHPVLREPMPFAVQEYLFLCKRDWDRKPVEFAEIRRGNVVHSLRDWVFITPTSMEPTGEAMDTLMNGPDMPELDLIERLLRRHGR